MPADTKKPVLLMQLPLGVYLPAGATLQIGKDEAKTLPFTSCARGGCIAEYAITDAELAAIAKGADITISAQGGVSRKPFTLTVPALGFAAAYAKIK
jgi:invasion protein IalB